MREEKIQKVADAIRDLLTTDDITNEEAGAGFARALHAVGHMEGYTEAEEDPRALSGGYVAMPPGMKLPPKAPKDNN